jgi:hypothetical protein
VNHERVGQEAGRPSLLHSLTWYQRAVHGHGGRDAIGASPRHTMRAASEGIIRLKEKRSRTRLQLVLRQNGYWKTNCFVMEVERSS